MFTPFSYFRPLRPSTATSDCPLELRQIPFFNRAYSCPCLSFDCRVPTGTSSNSHLPRSGHFHEHLVFSAIFMRSPRCGKESSLFIPSFPLIPSPYPYGTLPTLSAVLYLCIGVSPLFFESFKHFLFVSFFCTFIIANIFRLSRGF